MRKIVVLILSLVLVMTTLAACGQGAKQTPGGNGGGGAAAGELKTGLAVISSIAKSTDAGEKDGLAQIDSTVAAVTVDAQGKIVSAVFDAAQTKINFSAEGKVITPRDTVIMTKNELGDQYGMRKASGIKKEWNEQAAAFAQYVQGKTISEVRGIALNEEGAPSAADLTSSVTIHVTDLIAALEKAVNNAQSLGAKAGDKLGLGIVTTISNSTDATAEKDGLAQAYSMYTAATFGADGKITSSIIDSSQSNVNFNTSGKITTDIQNAKLQTKNELGDQYGMRKASGIKKEWNEQAAAFAQYVKGKTISEVKGIALNDEGKPAEAELASSVTVHVTDFIIVLDKASQNAR
jgi:hypothetical protein